MDGAIVVFSASAVWVLKEIQNCVLCYARHAGRSIDGITFDQGRFNLFSFVSVYLVHAKYPDK